MTLPTDREKAERAKERANEESTKPFDPVGILCPACNEPVTVCEPNPNEYIHKDTDSGWQNDRAAYEISPQAILDAEPENPWDQIHVVPETAEFSNPGEEPEEVLRVIAYKHDHSTEGYQLWKEQVEKIEENERRAEENVGLDDYATDGGARTVRSSRYDSYPSDLITDAREEDGVEPLERECPVTGQTRTVVRWVELDDPDGGTREVALEHGGESA